MATRKAKRTKAAKQTKKAPARKVKAPARKAKVKAPARKAKVPARGKPASPQRRPGPRPISRVTSEVDDYLAQSVAPPWKAVMAALQATVKTACPGANDAVHLGFPIFSCGGLFAWMRAYPDGVSLGFWRGDELDDPEGLLEDCGDGRRRLMLRDPKDLPISKIDALVRQACALNMEKGDPTSGHEVVEEELV